MYCKSSIKHTKNLHTHTKISLHTNLHMVLISKTILLWVLKPRPCYTNAKSQKLIFQKNTTYEDPNYG